MTGLEGQLGRALRWSRWHSFGAGLLVVVAVVLLVLGDETDDAVVDALVISTAVVGIGAAWLSMIQMSNASDGGFEGDVTGADRARVSRAVVRGRELDGWDRGLARQMAPRQLWMQSCQVWGGALALGNVGMLGLPGPTDSVMTVVLFPFLVIGGAALTALAQWSALRWRQAAATYLAGPTFGP